MSSTRRSNFCVFAYTCFRNSFTFVKNKSKVEGLKIFGHDILYTAHADDSNFFLKDRKSIIELINEYLSKFSGLRPN